MRQLVRPTAIGIAALLVIASPLAAQTSTTRTSSARDTTRRPVDYSAPADAPYTAENVTVPTPMGHTLAGTLTLPRGASRENPVPAIVTATGSGGQDRDEYIGLEGYRPFRQFADSLARRGVAVLRMDDRGIGASKGTHKGSTSGDFAEDIRAGLAYLRTRPEIDARRLGLLGHSEGGIIVPLAALKEPDLRGIVILAARRSAAARSSRSSFATSRRTTRGSRPHSGTRRSLVSRPTSTPWPPRTRGWRSSSTTIPSRRPGS